MKPTLRLRNLLLASSLLATISTAHALDYYWDSDDSNPGFGTADGIWGTSTYISESSDGTGATANTPSTTDDTLNIGTATLSWGDSTPDISLNGTQNIGTIIMGAGQTATPVRIGSPTAGTVNFADTGTITNNSTQALALLSTLTGAATRLDINATGTVSLAAVTNSYLGTTYINSGSVNVNNVGSLGTGAGSQGTVVASGARINFNNSTINFDSAETFTIAGSGVGGTTGALYATSDRDISFAGGVTLSGNATAYADSGTSSFVYKAGINLGSSTMTFHTESATAFQTVQTTKITGNGGIIKSGPGQLTISIASDYTGNTTINGGTLTIATSNHIASSSEIFIGNGATLSFSAAPWAMGTNQKITGTGATGFFTSTGAATSGLRMNGGNTISSSGTLTISRLEANGIGNQITGGDIQTGGTTNTIARRGLIVGNTLPGELTITGGTVTSNGGTALSDILGVGAGVGSLIINGSAAAYANTGYLDFGNNNGTGGSGTLTVTNGSASIGTLRYNTTATGNAIVNLNGGTLNLGGISLVTATYASRQINFNGGQLVATGSLALDNTFTLNVQNGGAKINTNGNSVSVTGDLVANGTGGLSKSGDGTLTLSGTNTYSGDTTVSAGTLALDSANANNQSSTVTIAAGATLNLNYGGTDTVDKLFIGTTQMAAGIYGPSATSITQITGTGTLTVSSGPTAGSDYNTWIAGTFTNGTIPEGQRGANQDYDNDGISNLVEYAIAGEDPTVPKASIGSFNGTTLSFTKRVGTNGLIYAIQESTDLGILDGWTEVSGGSYTNTTTTISYTLPGGPAKNFLRLQVTSN